MRMMIGLSLLFLAGCQAAVQAPVAAPQERADVTGGRDAAATQEANLAKLEAAVRILADIQANVLSHLSASLEVGARAATSQPVAQTAGRDTASTQTTQTGGVHVAITDGEAANGTAGAAGAGGLGVLVLKLRRRTKHLRSLIKAIRRADDTATTDQRDGVDHVLDCIGEITDRDETESDNRREVKRLKPRSKT